MTTEKRPVHHIRILNTEIDAEKVNPDSVVPEEGQKTVSGTEEWASVTVNCCTGCPHDCLYCYARHKAVNRYKRIKPGEWPDVKVRQKDVLKRHGKYSGTVMFPTTHDIVPKNLYPCMMVLMNLLTTGNKVLIVSKPWNALSQYVNISNSIRSRFYSALP
jgi:DNA repair photolyase